MTALILVLCFFVSACGFQPLYGEKAAMAVDYRAVEIANIPNREGLFLRNELMDRLYGQGGPQQTRYLLAIYSLSKRVASLGIRKDATSTRGQIEISAIMRLIDRTTGTTVLDRVVTASGGYNRIDNRFATLVSEAHSTDLALTELSEVITTELDLYFQRQGNVP